MFSKDMYREIDLFSQIGEINKEILSDESLRFAFWSSHVDRGLDEASKRRTFLFTRKA